MHCIKHPCPLFASGGIIAELYIRVRAGRGGWNSVELHIRANNQVTCDGGAVQIQFWPLFLFSQFFHANAPWRIAKKRGAIMQMPWRDPEGLKWEGNALKMWRVGAGAKPKMLLKARAPGRCAKEAQRCQIVCGTIVLTAR